MTAPAGAAARTTERADWAVSGEGASEHGSERTPRCVSDERSRATPAGAAPGAPWLAPREPQLATGVPEAKIETWASSGSITPKTFCRDRRWTHDPQLSK